MTKNGSCSRLGVRIVKGLKPNIEPFSFKGIFFFITQQGTENKITLKVYLLF